MLSAGSARATFVALAAACALAGGCFVLGGFDFDVQPKEARGSTGGAGGSGAEGGGGTAGGAAGAGGAPCTHEPGTPCYSGPEGTEDVGICEAGVWACTGDGETCEGEIVPSAENCLTTDDDESCDTFNVCTGVKRWIVVNSDQLAQRTRRARADANGYAYVVGDFDSSLTFDGVDALSASGKDAFVARVTPDGVVQWVKPFGSSGPDDLTDLAVDAAGGVVVVGRIAGEETAGSTGVNAGGDDALFVARLDAGGSVTWAHAFGVTVNLAEPHLAIAPTSGEIVLAGGFKGDFAFAGKETLSNTSSNEDVWVARLAGADGEFIDAKAFSGQGVEYATGVAVGPGDRVALSGTYDNLFAFDGTRTLPAKGGADAFVAVLDASLVPQWAASQTTWCRSPRTSPGAATRSSSRARSPVSSISAECNGGIRFRTRASRRSRSRACTRRASASCPAATSRGATRST